MQHWSSTIYIIVCVRNVIIEAFLLQLQPLSAHHLAILLTVLLWPSLNRSPNCFLRRSTCLRRLGNHYSPSALIFLPDMAGLALWPRCNNTSKRIIFLSGINRLFQKRKQKLKLYFLLLWCFCEKRNRGQRFQQIWGMKSCSLTRTANKKVTVSTKAVKTLHIFLKPIMTNIKISFRMMWVL